MATPYLIADSAQVTVLRSLASTAFGKYGLKLPEGVDLEDVYEVSAAGNELAYVSSLGGNRRVGGMFRRFVRADVDVTAQGEDMVPASDVERVLDEAAKRVSGDFFLESDISKAGLGPWVPMVDFHVGDIANVEIWGRVVPLVVTRIEPKRTEHSDNDWSVHVGGQLLSDSEARLAENAEIYNAVVSDRRELAGLDGKIRAETSNRKAAISAESARSDAYADSVASGVESRLSRDFAASYARYSQALSELGDTWRRELQSGLSAEQQARVEALRQEQKAREKAGTDLRGQLEKALDDAVASEREARIKGDSEEARARQKAISDLSQSFTTDLQAYGELVKEAKDYVDPATQQVVNFWSKENQNNFNKAVQLTLSAQAAYNDVNNIKWVSQDAWNEQQEIINAQNEEFRRLTEQLDAQQNEQIEQLTAVQQQMAEESQGRIREIMATPAGTSDPNIPVKGTRPDGSPGWHIPLRGTERNSLFEVSYYKTSVTAPSGTQVIKKSSQVLSSIDTNGVNIDCEQDITYVFARWAQQSKKQVSVDKSGGGWDVSRSSWEYVMSYPAPSKTARQVALRLKVTWAAATYDDTYGIRLRAGNRTLKTFTTSKLGPVTFLGNGEQWMSSTVSNATVYAGETIKVDVYSTATLSGGRRVKRAELTGTWIEDV